MTFIVCRRKFGEAPRQLGFVTGETPGQAAKKLGIEIEYAAPIAGFYNPSAETQEGKEFVYLQRVPELNNKTALKKAIHRDNKNVLLFANRE